MATGPVRDWWVSLLDSFGAAVSGTNPLPTTVPVGTPTSNGILSAYSNSDTPLAANGVFTPSGGTSNGFDDLAALGWPSALEVSVNTNVAGNTGSTAPSIVVEWSQDGTTVDFSDGAQVNADTPFGGIASGLGTGAGFGGVNMPDAFRKSYAFQMHNFQYCRVVYRNGSSIQTTFHYRTLYRYNPTERGLNYRYSPIHGSWEPVPTNAILTMISNATRAGNVTGTTGKRINLMHIGLIFALIVTAVPASPAGLDVILEVSYDNGATYVRVNQAMTGFYITNTGTFNFIWHPSANNLSTGLSASTAKQMVGFPLSSVYQIRVVPQDNSGAVSYTYSGNVALITQ